MRTHNAGSLLLTMAGSAFPKTRRERCCYSRKLLIKDMRMLVTCSAFATKTGWAASEETLRKRQDISKSR